MRGRSRHWHFGAKNNFYNIFSKKDDVPVETNEAGREDLYTSKNTFNCGIFLECCSCSTFIKGAAWLCLAIAFGMGVAALAPGAAIVGGAGVAKAVAASSLSASFLLFGASSCVDTDDGVLPGDKGIISPSFVRRNR